MKGCLQCNKDISAMKPSAKFCSTSCRVMFSRKNKDAKKMEAEKSLLLQTQVLLNSVVDMVGRINYGVVPTILDAPRLNNYTQDEPLSFEKLKENIIKPKLRRSFEYFQQAKLECENAEQWAELKEEIQSSDLSPRQKALLIS